MNKNLILITRRFPYFRTEAFLESEIKILSEYFEEITIFPSEISNESRPLPHNVKVIDDFAKEFQNKRKRIIKTIPSFSFWQDLFVHRKQIHSLEDVLRLFQFSSSALTYFTFFTKKKNLDNKIIYTYWLNEATYSFLKIRHKKDIRSTVISRAHRYDIYENLDSTTKFWPYRAFTLANIDQVYSISMNGKEYLENRYGHLDKITVSKLGVFDKKKISRRSKEGQLSIVSVSRIHKLKRVDLISSSILNFSRSFPNLDIRWTHFGDGDYLEKIQDSITQTENLKINLAGSVKNNIIYDFYENEAVDLFINLSSSEGIPVSIMEAQSFGIPAIATDVGGSGEIVDHLTGKLISPNPDTEEVEKAIQEVLNKKIPSKTIKSIWQQRFNAETNYNLFAQSLLEIKKNA